MTGLRRGSSTLVFNGRFLRVWWETKHHGRHTLRQSTGWLPLLLWLTDMPSVLAPVGPWIPSDRWAVLSLGTETDNDRANGVSSGLVGGGGKGATKVDPGCVAIK